MSHNVVIRIVRDFTRTIDLNRFGAGLAYLIYTQTVGVFDRNLVDGLHHAHVPVAIENAFEDAFLNSDSEVQQALRHLVPCLILGDVITDNVQHFGSSQIHFLGRALLGLHFLMLRPSGLALRALRSCGFRCHFKVALI